MTGQQLKEQTEQCVIYVCSS